MSKSFKFKENNYLDASGITYNREKLSDLINNLLKIRLLTTTDGNSQVSDNQTKVYQLARNGFYLFIDSHPYNNNIGVINGFDGAARYILQTSSSHLVFTYNSNNNQMTVKTVNGARLKIYLIEGQGNV